AVRSRVYGTNATRPRCAPTRCATSTRCWLSRSRRCVGVAHCGTIRLRLIHVNCRSAWAPPGPISGGHDMSTHLKPQYSTLGFDPDALREKYRQERDKRIRAEGN